MPPCGRHKQLEVVPEAGDHEAHSVLQLLNVGRDYVAGRILNAEIAFFVSAVVSNVPQQRLVSVENAEAAFRHAAQDLQLRLQNSLAAAEMLNVHRADVGDDRKVRSCDIRQVFHLSEMVHAHFEHRDLRPLRNVENAHWKSEVVVMVSVGARRAELPLQDAGRHFLRRRLADASGNADHLQSKELAIARCDLSIGQQRVRHDKARKSRLDRMLDQRGSRAVFRRSSQKIVAVHTLALQRNEQISRRDGAGIRLNARDARLAAALRNVRAAPCGDLAHSQFFHFSLSKCSATISRSSICLFSWPTS